MPGIQASFPSSLGLTALGEWFGRDCPLPLLAGLPRTKEVPSPGFSLGESQEGGNGGVVPEGGDGMLALLPELDRIQQPLRSALTPAPCSCGSQPLLSRPLSVQ